MPDFQGGQRPLVWTLAVLSTVSYGALYYAQPLLAVAAEHQRGWTRTQTGIAFTLALLVTALVAPAVGRALDARGGRVLIGGGAVLGSLAFVLLALSSSYVPFVIGWLLAGVAMALTFYEAVFTVLGQVVSGKERTRATLTINSGRRAGEHDLRPAHHRPADGWAAWGAVRARGVAARGRPVELAGAAEGRQDDGGNRAAFLHPGPHLCPADPGLHPRPDRDRRSGVATRSTAAGRWVRSGAGSGADRPARTGGVRAPAGATGHPTADRDAVCSPDWNSGRCCCTSRQLFP
ncbi:MFS transporter [Deinococcus sp. YIM 77859]|uniref:MFS transporter n=1 Tax=Deinococcus sp. YIM 77859 TaxID=1540221 RepID=UPI00068E2922|nr:MFS transporter [Deinococcus sp. YIM 77859]